MNKQDEKKIMKRGTVDKRTFSYVIDNVALEFTLRTDVKTELVAFKQMLLAAINDVDVELEKHKH